MPLRTSLFERIIFFEANLGPGPMVDLFGALAFKAVLTASELGVFDALEDGPLEPQVLAERLGVSERGARFLLEALEPLGYVEQDGGGYRNSPMSSKWLTAAAPVPLAALFTYFDDMLARWQALPDAVRRGHAAQDGAAWNDAGPGRWDRYHAGMLAISRLLADEILSKTPVAPTARRLLDLGGSHGLHAARFCRAHPLLTATVFDLPQAQRLAEQTIEAEGVADRVRFEAGDFTKDELGHGWDVVLLFNVIRVMREEGALALLGKIAASMSSGGQLVVMDQLTARPGSRFIRANQHLIDLELFAWSPGDVYRSDQVAAWIESVGFGRPRYVPLHRSNGQGLLIARR